jgi:hypothetical protein
MSIGLILIEKKQHSSVLDVQSFRVTDCDTDHSQVVGKVQDRLAVSIQRSHIFLMERFNVRKLHEIEAIEQYQIEISNRLAHLTTL